MTDTRTYEQYTVVGRCEILDSKTGEFVRAGGVVNLDPEPSMRTLESGDVQEFAGVQIRALLQAGHIAPIKPALGKDEKKA